VGKQVPLQLVDSAKAILISEIDENVSDAQTTARNSRCGRTCFFMD
jgi:hypothetical protein